MCIRDSPYSYRKDFDMATNKLFGSWTWTRKFPEPFNDPAIEKDSTDHVSSYNQVSAKKSTLHMSLIHI